MITEDYVSFEVAKLLKEKGFDEICHSVYDDNVLCLVASLNRHYDCGYGDLVTSAKNTDYDEWEHHISAPTLQMAMKWLREVHKWHIEISRGEYGYFVHIVSAKNLSTENYAVRIEGGYNLPYEKACEAGIRYCLENLI